MTTPVLADTGPLYAAVDPSDVHHRRALTEFARLARNQRDVIVSFPILLESYSLVRRRFASGIALRWLSEARSGILVNPAPEDYRQAIVKVHAYADQKITLFDATLAVLSLRMGLQVWTYDHHFDVMQVPVWR
jgi:predicted nucleic acid-binding protein